jgi:hypothetical protein
LDDQVDHAKQVIAELWNGPVEYKIIAQLSNRDNRVYNRLSTA